MRFRAVVLFVAAFVPCSLAAQPASPALQLTLDEAIERGLATSHRLAEAAGRRDASEAVVGERRSATLPQLQTLAGYMRTNHVEEFGIVGSDGVFHIIFPDAPDNYQARLDLRWPLYTGGRLDALTDAARMESSAAADDVEALRADVRLDITRAFWTLVVAGESLSVVNDSLARMGAHVQDVRNQLDAGLVPPSDVFSSVAQESRQRMLSVQAGHARDVAEAELARLIGALPGSAIRPDANLQPGAVSEDIETLVARAIAERRDRRALLGRLSAADFRAAAAGAGSRPTVAVAGGVDVARPNPRFVPRQERWRESWDAGVNVSWSLFDGGRTRSEVAEAAASKRAIQARIDELDSMVALEVRRYVAEIGSSHAAIAAADDSLRAAIEARRVLDDRFNAGVATNTDVLDAQSAVLQAGLDRTQAVANSKVAEARLQRALGR